MMSPSFMLNVLRIVFAFLVLATALLPAAAQERPFSINESPLPKPTGPVMDYAGVLGPATRQRIEDRVIEFRDSSSPSVEIGVAIVNTTGGRPIFEYSAAVARGWGIGSRNDDDPGLLLFVAIKDRKYFTQVSRDLEDELPDGLVGSIQRRYLVPEFKKGNYAKGIEDTVDAYIRAIEAKQSGQTVPAVSPEDEYERDLADIIFDAIPNVVCQAISCIGLILVILVVIAGSSGGGGGKRRRRIARTGFAGALLASFLEGLATGGSSSSGWSSGGWGSGGSSGWGGSSGGSWGGFGGGGSFGGGGAGGGW